MMMMSCTATDDAYEPIPVDLCEKHLKRHVQHLRGGDVWMRYTLALHIGYSAD